MPHTLTKRQLIEDFETVAEFYGLCACGEYDIAKQVARDDIESAKVCFADLANRIRGLKND
jgi:hypothetical protein